MTTEEEEQRYTRNSTHTRTQGTGAQVCPQTPPMSDGARMSACDVTVAPKSSINKIVVSGSGVRRRQTRLTLPDSVSSLRAPPTHAPTHPQPRPMPRRVAFWREREGDKRGLRSCLEFIARWSGARTSGEALEEVLPLQNCVRHAETVKQCWLRLRGGRAGSRQAPCPLARLTGAAVSRWR